MAAQLALAFPEPSPLGEAAAELTRIGFAVVPVRKGQKKPAIPDWPRRAARTPADASRMFADHPGCGIGIVTGAASGVVVLDVDSDKGGDPSLAALVERIGPLPGTVVVRTPGGGWHYYFAVGADVPRSTKPGALGRGLDFLGANGHCIVPPTLRGARGYTWVRSPFESKPAPLPDALRRAAVEAGTPPAPPGCVRDAGVVVAGRPDSLSHHLRPRSVPEGTRNNSLHGYGSSLRGQGADGPAVRAALYSANDSGCRPPLPRCDVAKVIASVLRYPRGANTALPPAVPAGALLALLASTAANCADYRTDGRVELRSKRRDGRLGGRILATYREPEGKRDRGRLRSGIGLRRSSLRDELIRWLVREGWTASKGPQSGPVALRVDGGAAALAEALGISAGRRAAVWAVLTELRCLEDDGEPGRFVAGVREDRAAGALVIEPGPLLLPGAAKASRDAYEHSDPGRQLIPVLDFAGTPAGWPSALGCEARRLHWHLLLRLRGYCYRDPERGRRPGPLMGEFAEHRAWQVKTLLLEAARRAGLDDERALSLGRWWCSGKNSSALFGHVGDGWVTLLDAGAVRMFEDALTRAAARREEATRPTG